MYGPLNFIEIRSITLLICLCGLGGERAILWLPRFSIKRLKPFTASVLDQTILRRSGAAPCTAVSMTNQNPACTDLFLVNLPKVSFCYYS